ncbi:hypothetical protein CHRY9390_01312 [Chryseobacterium aquaeductus]|uniref:Uncharacterized protein n=1 Tax=Chryseobacterium aquaeductus TaxID=2675056 RepID=A0A9N8QQF3_9FLAO|nr:hypothetical protein [Chryseobacterium aquaeductus]CAA7330641.1 hypothetical protein CHRY9390_01312 [Chryseobacterium potabilaquae]CAD7805057.1 hypothetical protein CHRY9390_01312 [Chryseobacterium aquaeductus]
MKKTHLLTLLLILLINIINAQTTTFLSEKTNQPLPKVSVFGKDGSIVAYSDIDGKIERKKLTPSQEKFQLVYDNLLLGTFSFTELDQDVVKLNDRVKDIEAVVIKNNKPAKYFLIKGNFNAYVTLNNKLNCYVDGIVTYVFDNKTKKVKSTNIEQYRIFRLENAKNEKKEMGSWDYNSFLELPRLKSVGNVDEYKQKNTKVKELKGNTKDEIEITGEALQEKELALFGYRFFDIRGIVNVSYEKDSKKTLRDLLESNEIAFIKVKHKSEPEYNQIIVYKNFTPTELDFSNSNDVEKVKYDKNISNYKTHYWQDPSFPNMQTIFSSFFKEDLKEKENKK